MTGSLQMIPKLEEAGVGGGTVDWPVLAREYLTKIV